MIFVDIFEKTTIFPPTVQVIKLLRFYLIFVNRFKPLYKVLMINKTINTVPGNKLELSVYVHSTLLTKQNWLRE